MKVLADSGGGITEESKQFFSQNWDKIGRVYKVISSFDDRMFNTEIQGTEGVLLLSGFSCGYPGTGPRGLEEILKLLGWNGKFQDILDTHLFIWTVY